MVQRLHHRQLAVLESPILQDLLDCHHLASLLHASGVDDTERPVAQDLLADEIDGDTEATALQRWYELTETGASAASVRCAATWDSQRTSFFVTPRVQVPPADMSCAAMCGSMLSSSPVAMAAELRGGQALRWRRRLPGRA